MSEVYISDADGSVTYSGVWVVANDTIATTNTLHVANSTVDSRATLIFTGITVRVYGYAINTLSSYTIDGGDTTFPNATRSSLQTLTILLYTSSILPNGQHNLTINANNLTIDYFLVITAGDTTTTSSAVISSTFTSSGIQPPASTTSVADSATGRSSFHQKIIIGVVIALVIVGTFSAFCWIRHRRKLKKESEDWALVYAMGSSALRPGTYIPTHPEPANPPQMIERSPPLVNYPTSEPPSYEAEDAGHLTSTHPQAENPPQMTIELAPSPANYATSEPPPYYEVGECRTSD